MHPELFRIGPVVIGSYGVMLSLGFIAGVVVLLKMAARRNLPENIVVNLAFIVMISALVGSRMLYVLLHLEEFSGRWIYTFLPVQPDGSIGLSGLVFLGGVIGAILCGYIYLHRKQVDIWPYTDSIAPALALGLFFGRIGCFLNGCCFGTACDLPWAISLPDAEVMHLHGHQNIHPTQLYSAAYGLLIFAVLVYREKSQPGTGQLTALFLILYGIARFTVDFFRYYEEKMYFLFGLDFNQIISLIMFCGGCFLLYVMNKREKAAKFHPQ